MKAYLARAPPAFGLTDINPNTLEDKMEKRKLLPAEFRIPAEIINELTDEQKAELLAWQKRYYSDDPDMVELRRMDRRIRIAESDRKTNHTFTDKKNGKQYTASRELSYDRFREDGGNEVASDFDLQKLVEDRDTYANLSRALASLSKTDYQLLVGYYADGESQDALAKRFNIPRRTVTYRITVALKKLKKFF